VATGGISGVAVSVAALGGVLAYAGFRGVSPVQALRDVAGGKPPPVTGTPADLSTAGSTSSVGLTSPSSSGLRGRVVAAASSYSGDTYSQPKRRQPGYSDCSAFVDKALVASGIDPPGSPWANTANYRLAGDWRTIPPAQAQPGDIAVSLTHMVLVTGAGGSSAIGQQRTGVNVRTGPVTSLMSGQPGYVVRTYKGYSSGGSVLQA
jgi:cell wall-associated NlpC family hydrolase